MNQWGVPKHIEDRVKDRDRNCVYCHIPLKERTPQGRSRKSTATFEHINNDRWDDVAIMDLNVVRSCTSCNASKGTKRLLTWLTSNYCKERGISARSVASPVRAFLRKCRSLA